MWNNDIAAVTGYTTKMLTRALFDLCIFIRNNLEPDRLAGFDVESVLYCTDLINEQKTHFEI